MMRVINWKLLLVCLFLRMNAQLFLLEHYPFSTELPFTFWENQSSTYGWFYFSSLFSVPLLFVSVMIPYYLGFYCSINPEIRWYKSSSFVLLPQSFGSCRTFVFSSEFWNQVVNFYTKSLLVFWLKLHWIYSSVGDYWHLNNIESSNPGAWYITSLFEF